MMPFTVANRLGSLSCSRRCFLATGLAVPLLTLAPGTVHNAVSSLRENPTTLVLVTNRAPSDLDPHSAYDLGSGVALQGPYEGLIRLKPGTTGVYEPLLAESWSVNEDKSVWTFRLREGVTFHDGTPLDSEVARASFERLLHLGLGPSTVLGRFVDDPAQITATDARTLVFDLGQPQPLFEAALASAYGTAIVNVAALRDQEVDADWGHGWAVTNSAGLGTGPYRVDAFDVENGVVLRRYDDYWGGWQRDQFDQIVIRVVIEQETRRLLIENGDADIATTLPLQAIPDLKQHPELIADHRYTMAVLNMRMTVAGPLESAQARQALCWAFPYDEVITGVFEGYAKRAIGPVAELSQGFAPETFRYSTDLGRARSLLQVAGIEEGTTLTLLLLAGNADTAAIAELFQANLSQVGMTLAVQVVDAATFVGVAFSDMPTEERPNLFLTLGQPDYNDGWNQLWPQVSCMAWQDGNLGHYCNAQVEQLLDQAQSAAEPFAYQQALDEIQRIVTYDDPAAIHLAQLEWLTVLRHDVAGFAPNLVTSEIIDFYGLRRRGREPLSGP
jgi:peptide/nickel transport system substrate-binding protein